MEADFSGYATKAGLKCSDGRTIMPEAFQHSDGLTVPLVWQHGHNDPGNVLGHAVLEGRKDGVYTYGYFNDTPSGKNAKTLVQHGDITALSIYANQLVERSKQVFHGFIKEVSLVLSGANPGALIEHVTIAHSDGEIDTLEDEAIIFTGLSLEHEDKPSESSDDNSDDDDSTIQNIYDSFSDEQKDVVHFMIGAALDGSESDDDDDLQQADSDDNSDNKGRTVKDVYDSFTDEQKDVVHFMIGAALDESNKELKQADSAPKFGTPEWQAKFGKGGAAKSADKSADKSSDKSDEKSSGGISAEQLKKVANQMLSTATTLMGTDKPTAEQLKKVAGQMISTAGMMHSDITSDDDKSVENSDTESDDDKSVEHTDIKSDDDKSDDETKSDNDEGDLKHQEGTEMTTHNVFEQNGVTKQDRPTLTHSQLQTIVEDAQRLGSLKESFLAHVVEYGIENIDFLFPDAKAVSTEIDVIGRRQDWVQSVIGGAKHSPFSRIKSRAVDLTADEARAKGYVKASLKKEEVVKLLKRVTTPTTIYKKQKLDRDDVVDITDLDVISWLKGEMRVMLDEELARAVLIGDGRDPEAEDKIDEACLRPIAFDDEMYSHPITVAAADTGDEIIEAVLRARTYYKGTGNPSLYTTDTTLTDLLLLKDTLGRRFYATTVELAAALRVDKIVVVEVMESVPDLVGIIVNIADYTLGADKGGAVSMFDDFDIDYNQLKYLIETRCSGALTKPKSALVIKRSTAGGVVTPTAPAFNAGTDVITIPTVTGVVYKIDGGVVTGVQAAITVPTEVVASPAATYAFAHNVDTDWTFTP